jgi:hypothetical protein
MTGRRRLRMLLAGGAGAAVVVYAGAASAYWSAGGSGTWAASTDTLPAGGTPTATVAGGTTVTVSFGRAVTPAGHDVTSYAVRRYAAPTGGTATAAFTCSWPSAGALSCVETGVPAGVWYYTDTPLAGSSWVGTESARSNGAATDSTAPTIAVTSITPPPNGNGYHDSSPVTVNLAATDNAGGAGVASITYWVGAGTHTTVVATTAAVSVAGDAHSVSYFATDNAGNASATSTQTVRIDTVAPGVATVGSYPNPVNLANHRQHGQHSRPDGDAVLTPLPECCLCNYRSCTGWRHTGADRWRRPRMPAVTVQNVLALPRVPEPDPVAGRDRPVVSVTTAPSGLEGEGFPVRRAFAGVDLRALDPFVHMDQMGEVEYAPGEPKGTPWHPHRGFETVTYMIDGQMAHQDSNGGGGLITNGDTQWMTAGAGILHIETPPEHLVASGGLFHGIQLWVNLPRTLKFAPPRYQDIRGNQVGLLSSPDGGTLLRVIAGELAGHPGPGVTHTPITLVHATLSPGASVTLPWRADFNALVYVLAGAGTVGRAGQPIRTGQLAVFGAGDALTVAADRQQDSRTPTLDVLVLGGRPIREPVFAYGPFVMNSKAELIQAFEDYQAGRLGSIPAAHADVRAQTPTDE